MEFKLPNGATNFPALFEIPSANRIMAMVEREGYEKVLTIMSAAIHSALENISVSKPLTPDQEIDVAEIIIESAAEDRLSFEDVLLFLQRVVRGQTGQLFNQISMQKLLLMFEDYRQERHSTILRMREEQHAQYKVQGKDGGKRYLGPDKDMDAKTMLELLRDNYSDTGEDKKD